MFNVKNIQTYHWTFGDWLSGYLNIQWMSEQMWQQPEMCLQDCVNIYSGDYICQDV